MAAGADAEPVVSAGTANRLDRIVQLPEALDVLAYSSPADLEPIGDFGAAPHAA